MILFSRSYFFNLKKIIFLVIFVLPFHSYSFAYAKPSGHFDISSLPIIQRGEYLLAQSRNDEALQLYQSLIGQKRKLGYAFRGMVKAYKSMNRLDEAEIWINEYLVHNSNSSQAIYALGYAKYLRGEVKKSEILFKQAVEFKPNNALALNNLGAILLLQKLYLQAAEKVREAIHIDPKEAMFFYNLEAIYKKMGNPEQIVNDYSSYLKQSDPNLIRGYGLAASRNMRQTGFRFYNEGKLDMAIQKFLQIEVVYKNIQHESGLVPVYFSLGLLHEEKGDIPKARNYFNQVLSLNSLHLQAKERLKFLQ